MIQIKKMVRWVRDGLMRWRKQVEDMQYHDGVAWVYSAYYEGGWSLEEIENHLDPLGDRSWTVFDRGARAAFLQITKDQQPKANQKGEPVDVPYFIHPGNMNPWAEGGPYQFDGCERVEVFTADGAVRRIPMPGGGSN